MSAQPNTDMLNIEIDGKAISVPKGSMIIQAADKVGIQIPRFCYHDKLAIAANCRMCLVEVEKVGKPQPACATPVSEGMKVFTQSDKALKSQRNVMEFLLINHPLDCPICDQGGECELQDLSVGYGRSVSRFAERKRVVADENLGPLIATEMTRCIHCTRCVRVLGEIAGTYELGGMDRGENLEIGTFVGKTIRSEISGNIIDVCPVGALTNKPFRFRARAWELLARESAGYHDALGSNLWLHTRRGEVMRTVPRDNEAINECWLSDRDRYSHEGLSADDRAHMPQVKRDGNWIETDWNEAIRVAAQALGETPANELGTLVHPATSSEEGALLARLMRALGSEHLDHRLRQLDLADGVNAAPFEAAVASIETAPLIVLIGCNPRFEIPLLHARLRKASLRGAQIHAINPVDFDFTFDLASKTIATPAAFVDAVLALAKSAQDAGNPAAAGELAQALAGVTAGQAVKDLFKALGEASGAVIIVGDAATQHPQASWLRAAAKHVARASGSSYNEIPVGANALGLTRAGVVPGAKGLDARAMLETPRQTYVLYGCEPPFDFADGALVQHALGQAKTVVAFSAYASEALKQVADVILPIGLLPEIDATLVNLDGFVQSFKAGAKAPGQARPGWKVLRALGGVLAPAEFDFTEIDEVRVLLRDEHVATAKAALSVRPAAGNGLARIATTAIYRADAVLRRAQSLNAHPLTRGPTVVLHPEDAASASLADNSRVRIGNSTLTLHVDGSVPRGAAWVEAGYAETASLPPYGAPIVIEKA